MKKIEVVKIIGKVQNMDIDFDNLHKAIKDGFSSTALWSLGYLTACNRMRTEVKEARKG